MTRLLTLAALAAAMLPAAASATDYQARSAVPVAAKRIVARDIAWSCVGASCRGTTDFGRPVLLCEGLARKAGRIESFTVDGRAMTAAELEKCNRTARGGAAPLLAQAN